MDHPLYHLHADDKRGNSFFDRFLVFPDGMKQRLFRYSLSGYPNPVWNMQMVIFINENKESGKKQMFIHASNIHQLIEVAPKTYGSSFWKPLIKPFSHYETLKDFYKVKMQTLYDEEGQALLRFDFTWSKDLLPMDYNRRHITGTAYVDAETCRLLRFDGSCNNCTVRMGIMSYPITIDFHMEYDYSQDVASVSNIAIQCSNDFMHYRVLLFAIEDDKQEGTVTKASGSNIVTALKEAGYDGSLWSKYDIIKRTKEEERVAFGK